MQFSDSKFRRMLGINKYQFDLIFKLFQDYVDKHWTKRGRPSDFTLVDRLILTFRYLRDYPTFVVLGNEFAISESFSNKIFNRVSVSLVKVLKLPNLNNLKDLKLETVIIDVSEQETERPKKTKNEIFGETEMSH